MKKEFNLLLMIMLGNNLAGMVLLYVALLIQQQEGARVAGTFIANTILIPLFCGLILLSCSGIVYHNRKWVWLLLAIYYVMLIAGTIGYVHDPEIIYIFQ